MLSASCEGCHGTSGNSPGSIPAISGRSADHIVQALSEYRSGARQATVMDRHATDYTTEEFRLIAENLAQQKKEEGQAQ